MLERAGSFMRRRNSQLLPQLAASCMLACAAPVAAQTWDWTYALSAPPTDAGPFAMSAPDADGFWALGHGLVRYRNDGVAETVRGVDIPDVVSGVYAPGGLSAALPGGGVAFTNAPYPHGVPYIAPDACSVTSYSAHGDPVWTTTIPDGISYCTRLDVDGAGALWLQGSQASLYQLGRDGTLLGMIRSPAVADFVARNDGAGAHGVYLLTTEPPARIIAVPRPGASEWTWTDPDATHQFQKLALGNDGNLYAFGRVGGGSSGALVVVSVTADGTQRFVRADTNIDVDRVLDVVPTTDDALYVIDTKAASTALQRIGKDGSVQWSRTAGCSVDSVYDHYLQSCHFSVTPQGDALIGQSRTLTRYDAAGALLAVTTLDPQRALALAALPSGDALLSISNSMDDMRGFVQVQRDGTLVPGPASRRLVDSGYDRAQSAIVADGSTYLLASGSAQPTALAKVAANGTLNWRVDIAAGYQLVADGNEVCVLSESGLACYAGGDGALRWSQAFHPVNSSALRALADGSIEVAGQEVVNYVEQGAWQRVFDAAGKLLRQTRLPSDGWQPTIGANGTLLLFSNSYRSLGAYDRNGTQLFFIPAPGDAKEGSYEPEVDVGPDGTALLSRNVVAGGTLAPYAWSISPQGKIRWTAKLRDGSSLYGPRGKVTGVIGNDGNVYFLLRHAAIGASEYAVTVQARAADSGALRWQHDDALSDSIGSELLQEPSGGRLLLLSRDARKLRTAELETAHGAIVRSDTLPCPADAPASGASPGSFGCDWHAAALGADSTLRIGAFVSNSSNASLPYVFALHQSRTEPVFLHAQAGMAGAWFAPYESGQGFMLDYIPGAGLFMPWFTYTEDNSNDPAQLVWYVLQGGDCCGSTTSSVQFTITRADPGAFATGAVGVRGVGTARMDFSDCNSAVLSYAFDASVSAARGRQGSIALQRLTPPSNPCQLDATHATPAQIANTPADGFDARQSGSWFDPQMAGQGLQFEIIPRGNGFGGLVFGAWFTFDPAGHADDDTREHWFTLQGDLAGARDGVATLAIVRTLGGAFDAYPTSNSVRVGSATLTLHGCDTATLDYRFDDADLAHAFRGMSGRESLTKIGGCAAP